MYQEFEYLVCIFVKFLTNAGALYKFISGKLLNISTVRLNLNLNALEANKERTVLTRTKHIQKTVLR